MPLVTRTSNQGNVFKEATTPNWLDGDIWSDTTANNVKVNVGGVATDIGATSFSSSAVVSATSIIGDYTQPTAAVATSETGSTEAITVTTGTATNIAIWRAGSEIRNAMKDIVVGHRNRLIDNATFKLSKYGSPTGNMTCVIRKSSDDSIVGTFDETLDVSTIQADPTLADFVFTSALGITTPNEDFFISLESSSGGGQNYIKAFGDGSSTNASFEKWGYITGWIENAAQEMFLSFDLAGEGVAANMISDNTATVWKSAAEVNPAIYVDMGGSALNVLGVAIYWSSESTETEIAIRISTDITFTSGENTRTILVTALTAGAWNYIRFNLKNARYMQIYGNSGASVILAINELKYLTKTDSEVLADLGILEISPTDTSLALDGT